MYITRSSAIILFILILQSVSFDSQDATSLDETIIITLDKNDYKYPSVDHASQRRCSLFNCFDIYQCEYTIEQKVKIYIYPPLTFINKNGSTLYSSRIHMSKEYWNFLEFIMASDHYEPNPESACVYVPSIDTLNFNHLTEELNITKHELSAMLNLLPFWTHIDLAKPGLNHIIVTMGLDLNMQSGTDIIDIGYAILASSCLNSFTKRNFFDLPIPSYQPSIDTQKVLNNFTEREWTYLIVDYESVDTDILPIIDVLELEADGELLVLKTQCQQSFSGISAKTVMNSTDLESTACTKDKMIDFPYPLIIDRSKYCLMLPRTTITDCYKSLGFFLERGCVPIIAMDEAALPFPDDLIWDEFSVSIPQGRLGDLISIVSTVDEFTYRKMQSKARDIWKEYFSTMDMISSGILKTLNRLVYPRHLDSEPNYCNDSL